MFPIRFGATAEIERPVEDVFRFVSDFENLPRWAVGVARARRIEGDAPGLSARYEIIGKGPRDREIAGRAEMTEWQPPTGFADTFASPVFRFAERYELVAL